MVSRPSFLFVEVFKGFPKERVPQRLPVSRPSLVIGEVFKVFPEDRVPQPLSRLFPQAPHRSMPRAPAHFRHDEWVCVVDVENDGEYYWNRLDNSSPSGLYRDVVSQVEYRVLPPL